eukprot:GAHX01002922.1.p1 GENE.GAHX01002922.1~~GAHX01002922.1.p1  ORF type:complete len:320 (+),score=47.57 GAHX01002922.1:228-1187(+)
MKNNSKIFCFIYLLISGFILATSETTTSTSSTSSTTTTSGTSSTTTSNISSSTSNTSSSTDTASTESTTSFTDPSSENPSSSTSSTTTLSSLTDTTVVNFDGFKNFGPLAYYIKREIPDKTGVTEFIIMVFKHRRSHVTDSINNLGMVSIHVQRIYFTFDKDDDKDLLLDKNREVSLSNLKPKASEDLDISITNSLLQSAPISLSSIEIVYNNIFNTKDKIDFTISNFNILASNNSLNGSPKAGGYIFKIESIDNPTWEIPKGHTMDQLFCDFNPHREPKESNPWKEPWMIIIYIVALIIVVVLISVLLCIGKKTYSKI